MQHHQRPGIARGAGESAVFEGARSAWPQQRPHLTGHQCRRFASATPWPCLLHAYPPGHLLLCPGRVDTIADDMPIIDFSKVDTYAFIDADSDEAKAFTTYLGYVRAIDDLITDRYGAGSYALLRLALDVDGRLTKLRAKPFQGDPTLLRSLLLNAWISEMHLHTVDDTDPGRVRISNHAAPVHSYYASSRMAMAWLAVLKGSAPTTHSTLLATVSKTIGGMIGLYPTPWGLRCSALEGTAVYRGFPAPPATCSNLAANVPSLDRIAQCLRTTRSRQLDELVGETKRQLKVVRAPNGTRKRRDERLNPTTVFDFLWRSRTRSNYGDPGMFYMGALGDPDVLGYHHAVRRVTAATMFIFEAMIAQRAQTVLEGASTHFISRDRSSIADRMLVPRLVALGLAAPAAHRGVA